MILTDVAVRRPVLAAVLSLLLFAFGLVAYDRLPLREYPDIDPPIVSIETSYPGASAAVVDSRITELIEDSIAGIEGIRFIESQSRDGRSDIGIVFDVGRDIEAAANDIRDRVAGMLDSLPPDAELPEIQKQNADARVIMWLNLVSTELDSLQLTDYARRYLQDRFSILPGVARVRVGGGFEYAMRIWLDRRALAARGITVLEVSEALERENIELPAGRLETGGQVLTARIHRGYVEPEDFAALVVGRGSDGHLVRLGEVAKVEKSAVEDRLFFRGNGVPMVGLGIVKQSTANTLEVARAAKALKDQINPTLPPGMEIKQSYDSSVFIEAAIREVWKTLAIATGLVVFVIWLFLGSLRAMLVPALTVPVSLVATFIALLALGFSINLLTLLAMVLAVGLVVDDSIVMLENIHRRITEGETPLVAAFRGGRQVGFAVVATSVVLVAVFVPISFLTGDLGRLFSEFALTMAAAVFFSTIVALTLSPMLCSKILLDREHEDHRSGVIDGLFQRVAGGYLRALDAITRHPLRMLAVLLLLAAAVTGLYRAVPTEYAPREDRGAFFVIANAPEGVGYDYIRDYMTEIETRLMPLVERGEVQRLLVRAPMAFGVQTFSNGIVIAVLSDWSQRRSAWAIMDEMRALTADLPGVRVFPIMRQGFGRGVSNPVEMALGGADFEQLAQWRDTLIAAIEDDNPGLTQVDSDYRETQPQLHLRIDRDRAADLGVSVRDIGETLQTLLGSRRVTRYVDSGEEYAVILEGQRSLQTAPADLGHLYVRSRTSGELVALASVVEIEQSAGASALNRYNRVRAITIEAGLADGYTLDQAMRYLERKVREVLPAEAVIEFKGMARDLADAQRSILFVFLLGLVVVFLVLAAQFESWVQPLVIMLTVPLAMGGALLGLWLSDSTLNVYSQIGLVALVGLAAKNGILIVEFTNQLRDQGQAFDSALRDAARIRFRPIVMTGITTAAGTIPLLLSFGAGAETRYAIGIVMFSGVVAATAFTLFVVPWAYSLLARRSASPQATARRLEAEQAGAGPQS